MFEDNLVFWMTPIKPASTLRTLYPRSDNNELDLYNLISKKLVRISTRKYMPFKSAMIILMRDQGKLVTVV